MLLSKKSLLHFYPRPPRGGRPGYFSGKGYIKQISIHALREEGDSCQRAGRMSHDKFLSTPSARRATRTRDAMYPTACISIHALREEGDLYIGAKLRDILNFYPRPPRGGRRQGIRGSCVNFIISIHALREEGDGAGFVVRLSGKDEFLSTPSARRATVDFDLLPVLNVFLSTPSARRATRSVRLCPAGRSYFYPRPPRGGRPCPSGKRLHPG